MKTGFEQLLDEARKKAAALDEKWKDHPWTEDSNPAYVHIVCVKGVDRHEHFAFWDFEHADVKCCEEQVAGYDAEIYKNLFDKDEKFRPRPGLDVCPATYIKEWRGHSRYPK